MLNKYINPIKSCIDSILYSLKQELNKELGNLFNNIGI